MTGRDSVQVETQARAGIVSVARQFLDGQMQVLEGARRICLLRHDLADPEWRARDPIRAVDSELDCFPVGGVRGHFALGALDRLDAELEEQLVAGAREDVLRARRAIVDAWA